MTPTVDDHLERLAVLLDVEEITTADAAWLTVGGGLFAAVRAAVLSADTGFIDRVEQSNLSEWIIDETPAIDPTGDQVRTRVNALVAAGRLALWRGGPVDTVTVGWVQAILAAADPTARLTHIPVAAASGFELLDQSGINEPGAAVAARCFLSTLAAGTDAAIAQDQLATVEFPVSRLSNGDVYTLTLRKVDARQAGLGQDLAAGLFTRADEEFCQALQAGWRAVNTQAEKAAVLWAVHSSRTQLPVDAVTGPSVGLAAAVAAAALEDRTIADAAQGWLFTGRVGTGAAVTSLRPPVGHGEYPQKLAAATGRLVMVPTADAAPCAQLADTARVAKLVGVATLNAGLDALVRHSTANHAFNHALNTRPPQRTSEMAPSTRRLGTVAVLGVLVVGVIAAALWNNQRKDRGPGAKPETPTPTAQAAATSSAAATTVAPTTTAAPGSTVAPTTTAAAPGSTVAPTTTAAPGTTVAPTTTSAATPPDTTAVPIDVPGKLLAVGVAEAGQSPGKLADNAPVYRIDIDEGRSVQVSVTSSQVLNGLVIYGPDTKRINDAVYLKYCGSKQKTNFTFYYKALTTGPHYIQVRGGIPTDFTIQIDNAEAETSITCVPPQTPRS